MKRWYLLILVFVPTKSGDDGLVESCATNFLNFKWSRDDFTWNVEMVVFHSEIYIPTTFTLHKKWSFLLRISSDNVTKSTVPADLVTFTEEILNGKLNFLCSVNNCSLSQSCAMTFLTFHVITWSKFMSSVG